MDIQHFDALVIGAGMAGATCAAHLALAGRKTALLEAEESAGYHTTGRSAAIWILNYGSADARILTGASRAFFEQPPEGFGPLARQRAVVFIAPPEQAAQMEQMIRDGLGMAPISPEAVRAMVPALRPGYAVSGGIEADAFDMDVAALHQGFLRQLRGHGTLALRHRAGRIWRQGAEWRAETSTGEVFAAPVVVNAAGAWGDEVAALAGIRPIGLQPKRRTACIIDPGGHDVADWPLLGDAAHTWYVRPEARTRLMVTPADETDDVPHDVQPDELDVAIAIDRMQQALDIPVRRIEHSWAGLRSFTPDRGLAIGESEERGFFWCCGQGGYGIQTAPAAGRLLAALVNGVAPEPALAPALPLCDPRRFARA
jgi:D-arginine dehydrogenase